MRFDALSPTRIEQNYNCPFRISPAGLRLLPRRKPSFAMEAGTMLTIFLKNGLAMGRSFPNKEDQLRREIADLVQE